MDQFKIGQVKRRIVIISALLLVFFGIVTWRLVDIQILEHSRWQALAQRIQEREVTRELKRGKIKDRNGIVLATNIRTVSIALDNYRMTKPQVLKSILNEELGLEKSALDEKIYRKSYFTWIARKIGLEKAEEIKRLCKEKGVQGLIYREEWKRVYPQGSTASNVIGFAGLDNRGLEGLELAMDGVLRGEAEQILMVTDVYGNPVQEEVLEPGMPGKDITLTLDAKWQHIAETMIDWGVNHYRAKQGFIILMDPQNGEVLALAQNIRYDLNAFSSSQPSERKNLGVTYPFEPGSLFKIFAGLAALKYNAVSTDDWISGDQPLKIAGHSIHNANYKSYGAVRLKDIITHSINTGMIRVAQKLGEQKLYQFLHDLGIGQFTGIELPGEVSGTLRDSSTWSKLAIGSIPIGQSVSVTGIRLASAVSAIANGGKLVKPTLIKEVDGKEKIADTNKNTPATERIAPVRDMDLMKKMMRNVVTEGTGKPSDIQGYQVSAKTGTAQKSLPGQGYVEGKYLSLFAGFLPQHDPQYMALVVLDEVKTKPFWGGYTSGVVFKKMMERIIQIKGLKPTGE